MTTKKDHPFFDFKKNCRKTAWDTPEHLNDNDWQFIRKLLFYIENNSPDDFFRELWSNYPLANDFFNRALGWPEGFHYCKDSGYVEKTALPSLKTHDLHKLRNALAKHDELTTDQN